MSMNSLQMLTFTLYNFRQSEGKYIETTTKNPCNSDAPPFKPQKSMVQLHYLCRKAVLHCCYAYSYNC